MQRPYHDIQQTSARSHQPRTSAARLAAWASKTGRHTLPSLASLLLMGGVILLTSCAGQCNMTGRTTIPGLDGKTLRLNAFFDDGNSRHTDTCRIVHGNFSFYSDVDTMYLASIYVDSERLLPVVIESGKIQITVDNIGPSVKGGQMNEKLYKFRNKQAKLYNKMSELDDKYAAMAHEGASSQDALHKYSEKMRKLQRECAELETKFIVENSNNVLGTSFFRMKYSVIPFPVITDEINEIIESASPEFFRDPYVRCYLNIAVGNPLSKPCKLPKK